MLERTLSPTQPKLSAFRNFLLLQYQTALGTAVHATPLISAIHAAVPGARVAAAASGFALGVLKGNPGLERLIATPSPLDNLRGAVGALRAANFFSGESFAVLQTTGTERTLISFAAMAGRGHTRVGFTVAPQLSAASLQFDTRLSQIANNLRIVEALGHGTELLQERPELLEPQIFPSETDLRMAGDLLHELGVDRARPIAVFVTQTSPTQRKSWRAERFRAVADSLHREYGMQIVFAGTAAEAVAIDALRFGLAFPSASVAGRTGLLELAALMSLCDIALTLDTGPMHLLRAMRVPMVILAPAWSPAVEWLPLGNPRARILKNADMEEAPEDYVIDEVSVDEVEQNLRELLAVYPPRSFTWHG